MRTWSNRWRSRRRRWMWSRPRRPARNEGGTASTSHRAGQTQYRQAQIFARQGITLDRFTLCNWVGRACWWLAPLHELALRTVLASPKVFAYDTTLPVLDPERHRDRTAMVLRGEQSAVVRAGTSGRCLSL